LWGSTRVVAGVLFYVVVYGDVDVDDVDAVVVVAV